MPDQQMRGAAPIPTAGGGHPQEDLYDFTEVAPFAALPVQDPEPSAVRDPQSQRSAPIPHENEQIRRPVGTVQEQRPPRVAPQAHRGPEQIRRPARPQSREIQPAERERAEQNSRTTSLVLIAAIGVVLLVIIVLAVLILTRAVPFPGL